MDNEVSGALHFSDDEFHRYLDNGASTFDLTVAKKHRIYSNATDIEMEDFQYLVANNFLIFTYKNKDYKFTIRRVEETETSIRLFCEDLSFDLLNEYRGPYIADKAYNIAKYVNDCLYDSGYTIGINEFAKNTRTLKWEGDDTVLKRLLSICNSFDAELEFETQLNNDRTVNKQLVHLRKRVGLNRPDIELKYGREVSSIRRNVDLTELITAIKPRGHENDGKYVTIKNIAKEVKDADGNVAYFTKKGSEYLYAPMANQIYGSPEKKSGGYIVGQFSYDTESDTELYNRALTELQLKCMPAYEYEIEGFYDVDIGDTVRAIDEAYNPILMLEARISEQVISFTDPTRNKTVYSNYRVLNNLVSQSLLDRIDDVKDYAEQVARTYIFSLKNVGSSMFKNGIGEVTYTAKAEKNNKDVTSEFDSFNWTKQLKDGTPDEAWNVLHVDFGTTLTVTPDDFEDTATFSYVALKGDETFGGASGVVTKIYDGDNGAPGEPGPDGKTTYLHIKYSDDGGQTFTENSGETAGQWLGQYVDFESESSADVNDYAWSLIKGDTGETGVSVASVVEEYYVSTSDTEQTGGAWSTTVPNNANPNLYVWRRVKNTMSDGTVSYTTPALIQGMTGIYPYIGPTQPANPKEGQQWWKSDSNGNVTDFYVYHDGSWQGQTIQQSVLNIVALNAVNITGSSIVGTTISGSTIRGGVISGAEIHSGLYSLEYKDAPLSLPGQEKILGKGVLLINNGTITDACQAYKESDPTTTIYQSSMNLFHDKISFYKDAPAPSYARLKQTWVGYDGLYIRDDEKFADFGQKTLTYQDLMTLPTVGIPAASGWTQYSTSGGNRPTATRNGRIVQLAGAFKNNAVKPAGTEDEVMGTLPVGYRPAANCNFLVQGTGTNIYLLVVQPSGNLIFARYRGNTGGSAQAYDYKDCGAGSWLNIACTYAAADL